MSGTTGSRDALLHAFNGRASTVTKTVIGRLYDNMPSYRVVPREQLAESIGQIIAIVAEVVRSGIVPAPDDIVQARTSAAARAQQDVPVQDIMRAFRFTIGGIHESLLQLVSDQEIPAAEMVLVTDTLWRFSDAYTTSQITAFQTAVIDRALHRARRTQQFLRDLADGVEDEAGMQRPARELGLRTDGTYAAVRARIDDGDEADRLRLELEQDAIRRGGSALYAVTGSELLGVTDTRPGIIGSAHLVGVGDYVGLLDAAASFRSAEVARNAAALIGMTGVVSAVDLGWKMAAAHAGDANAILAERYLEPLRRYGTFGRMIEDTLRAYLAADRSIPKAARSMPVHVNTLRYRLRRFEELTGRPLDATATIVELSWALEITARMETRWSDVTVAVHDR
ncbi:PucR family transcriptional regulator [Herbiconiux daphne]|uniref:Helix-turn-helix domain-containing protein n=1 Tax=Herbiconiux daphne TaxID=2970914 RepID=A0ABT2GYA0_9MICO|nr:PucR family transcriptional regulator [Herbiconiux daphne]MCS5732297.1 helix-turn-helix domain-containing protein [Herbiconiux daphne]